VGGLASLLYLSTYATTRNGALAGELASNANELNMVTEIQLLRANGAGSLCDHWCGTCDYRRPTKIASYGPQDI